MGSPLLHFHLLHYNQLRYLPPLLTEAARFDPALVAFELRDDGSPPAVQEDLRRLLAAHPGLKATLLEKNRGVVGMLESCLADTRAPYTYIGASDDAVCPSVLNEILGQLAPGETPFIVSDFYSLEEATGMSVLTEAIVPPALRLRGKLSAAEFRREIETWPRPTYLSSHALLCPTQLHREAGGYPAGLSWHADWFAFTVAALRSEVRYSRLPMACWRHSTGTYSHAGTRSGEEVAILRRMLFTLLEPRYADVRDHVMSPHLCPWVPDIGLHLLRAILPRPRLWRFLRAGHFRRALAESLAPLTERSRVLGRLIRAADFDPVGRAVPAFRSFVIRTILRLAGATVGRGVRFGKKFRVSQPGGLVIGDGVVFGDQVSLCAPHPVVIGRGAGVGDGVRIESENLSPCSPVPFIRRKSVTIGEGAQLGSGARLGPGAVVAARERLPAQSMREDAEERPLFYMNQDKQLCLDHDMLASYYHVGPPKAEPPA